MAIAPGARLGPYEVIAPLGRGAMGEVYRARDGRLGREVAIKVLAAEVGADPARLARFEREARSASALNHPNIVTVHDVGKEGGTPYLVTELLSGETLRRRLDRGRPGLEETLDIAVQIAQGLAAAHAHGVVHRDLKPENVFLVEGGPAKILDFGLAKPLPVEPDADRAASALATGTLQVVGTPAYMSPEQAAGRAVDFRSDQFALGCLLYEMLTGRQPYRRDSVPQTMAAVIEASAPPLPSAVPAPLRWIVERALAKSPERRWVATADLAADLGTLRERRDELSATAAAGSSGPPWVVRTATLAAALVAGAGLGALGTRSLGRPAAPPLSVIRDLTSSGRDSSPSPSPDGRLVAFSSARDERRRIWLKDLASGSEAPLTAGPTDDLPRFSPDGSQVLFVRGGGTQSDLYRVPVLGGEPRRVASGGVAGDWLPGGRRIVVLRWRAEVETTGTQLAVADLEGGGEGAVIELPGKLLQHPRVSPDGRRVALTDIPQQAGLPSGIRIVDLASPDGPDVAFLPGPPVIGQVSAAAWIDDDTLAYSRAELASAQVTSSAARIMVQDLDSEAPRAVLATPVSPVFLDVLGPGRLIFDGLAPGQNLGELPSSDPSASVRWLTRGSSGDRQPAYSPDGRWIVFSSNRDGNLDLWAVSTVSGEVRRLTEHPADDWDPAYTRDGKLVWSSNRSGPFEIWMAEADGSEPRQASRDGADAENPAATPDGVWIVYASGHPDHPGIFKTRRDGDETAQLVAGNVVLPDLSPDGRFVVYVANWGTTDAQLRMVRTADGGAEPWVSRIPYDPNPFGVVQGRARWLPDGTGVAYVSQDAEGTVGIFARAFQPGQEAGPERRLAASDAEALVESFALSPDGRSLTVAFWPQRSSVLVAENVPGIVAPRRQ